jgi:hypothetical protein
MKEKILKLRKLGYSYKRIEKELGCARSTISYHCKNNCLNKPNTNPNKINDNIINQILNEYSIKTANVLANELNVSKKTIYKYGNGIKKRKRIIRNKKENYTTTCLNCGSKTNRKFCSIKCSSDFSHKKAYDNFLNNNDKYCVGYYSAKNFKDFFLKEQNNKCAICGIEPIWANKTLVFVIDHIDGDCSNNKRKNLRLICPNCDSQTNTFKSKTKNSKRRNYIKENIIKNIKKQYGENLAG